MTRLEELTAQLSPEVKLGEIRQIAKELKKNHELALDLWQTKMHQARLLSILIMDKNLLDAETIDRLVESLDEHSYEERLRLMDWLFTNQLAKSKKLISLINSWKQSRLSLQRRTFWYYQGRLRWSGKTQAQDSESLLTYIEEKILTEVPEVQWAMNFLVGWIGVFEDQYLERCIHLGIQTELFKDQKVSKGCTPNYLPDFISIERHKRGKD